MLAFRLRIMKDPKRRTDKIFICSPFGMGADVSTFC